MPAVVTFDGPNKIITEISASGDNELSFQEIYSEWKEWVLLSDNAKFDQAISVIGGDAISPTLNQGSTFFMENGWRIRPAELSHKLTIVGNVFNRTSGQSIFTNTIGTYNVHTETIVSALVFQSVASLITAVYVDTDASVNGNGEASSPFNNIGDALNYAETNNLRVIYTYAEITLDRNLKNFQVIGIGNPVVELNGYDVKGTEIDRCTLRGNYIDSLVAKECVLDNNFYLKGLFIECGLNGDLICNDGDVTMQQPYSTIAGSARPTISLGGTGATNLSVRNYSGGLTIKDMNNSLDNATIEMSQGKLTLDTTCVAGYISCRGLSQFTDNSAGTNVDTTALWDTGKAPNVINGVVDANIVQVNEIVVKGNGTDDNPWNPV